LTTHPITHLHQGRFWDCPKKSRTGRNHQKQNQDQDVQAPWSILSADPAPNLPLSPLRPGRAFGFWCGRGCRFGLLTGSPEGREKGRRQGGQGVSNGAWLWAATPANPFEASYQRTEEWLACAWCCPFRASSPLTQASASGGVAMVPSMPGRGRMHCADRTHLGSSLLSS
jgi:hypothetical protein